PDDVDVIVFVPEAPGVLLREQYLNGEGVYGVIAVQQDYSGNARSIALALAKANRCTRVGVIPISVRQEVEVDNFVEQDVKGGAAELISASFAALVKRGCNPLHAYLKVVNWMRSFVNLVQGGIEYAWSKHSTTCEYAARTRGNEIINHDRINSVLRETELGEFAGDWVHEYSSGLLKLTSLRGAAKDSKIEEIACRAREIYRRTK
ncbi:MAG TPA: hypothetical protein VJ044_20700, partial [Candidatus Hodarchaeales archaeon]|nr:hypothetical protein [Candidatus Hodarchaeales archaeon]